MKLCIKVSYFEILDNLILVSFQFFIVLGVAAGGISDFPDDCRTGTRRQLKPWTNRDPKSILKFWNDKDNWYPTWEGEDAGLEVDYVRVWAL